MPKPPNPLPRVAGAVAPRPNTQRSSTPPPATTKPNKLEAPKAEPPKVEKPKKSRKKTKKPSAIDTALKTATLLDKHAQRLLKLTANWEGEATPDQQSTNAEIVTNLVAAAKLSQQILLDIDMLHGSGFNPTAVARRHRAVLAVGGKAAIKPKYYDPVVYGLVNQFEVILIADKVLRLQGPDPKQPQLVLPRSWVGPVDEVDVDDTLPPDIDADAAPEADGIGEDGDPDHRLPNEDELE